MGRRVCAYSTDWIICLICINNYARFSHYGFNSIQFSRTGAVGVCEASYDGGAVTGEHMYLYYGAVYTRVGKLDGIGH